jgi:hypothetical protein
VLFIVLGTWHALQEGQVNIKIFILMFLEQYLMIIAVPEALWVMFMCWGPYLVGRC